MKMLGPRNDQGTKLFAFAGVLVIPSAPYLPAPPAGKVGRRKVGNYL
jgi:hypothetical protein